jgi:hypothetical protein
MTAMLQSVTDRPRGFSAGLRHLRRRQRQHAADGRDEFAPHLVGTYSGIVPDGIADLEVGDIDWVGFRWSYCPTSNDAHVPRSRMVIDQFQTKRQ